MQIIERDVSPIIARVVDTRQKRIRSLRDRVSEPALRLLQDFPTAGLEVLIIGFLNLLMTGETFPGPDTHALAKGRVPLVEAARSMTTLITKIRHYIHFCATAGLTKQDAMLAGVSNSGPSIEAGLAAYLADPSTLGADRVVQILLFSHPMQSQSATQRKTALTVWTFIKHVLSDEAIAATSAHIAAEFLSSGAVAWTRLGFTSGGSDLADAKRYADFVAFGMHARAAIYAHEVWTSASAQAVASADLGRAANDTRINYLKATATSLASWETAGWFDVAGSLDAGLRSTVLAEPLRAPLAFDVAKKLRESLERSAALPPPPGGVINWVTLSGPETWERAFLPIADWITANPRPTANLPAYRGAPYAFASDHTRIAKPKIGDLMRLLTAATTVEGGLFAAFERQNLAADAVGVWPTLNLPPDVTNPVFDEVPLLPVGPAVLAGLPGSAALRNVLVYPDGPLADRDIVSSPWDALTDADMRQTVRQLLEEAGNPAGAVLAAISGSPAFPSIGIAPLTPALLPWARHSHAFPPSRATVELLTGRSWLDVALVAAPPASTAASWPVRALAHALRHVAAVYLHPAGDPTPSALAKPFTGSWYLLDAPDDRMLAHEQKWSVNTAAGLVLTVIPFRAIPVFGVPRDLMDAISPMPDAAVASPMLPVYRITGHARGQDGVDSLAFVEIGGWLRDDMSTSELLAVPTYAAFSPAEAELADYGVHRAVGDEYSATTGHAVLTAGGTTPAIANLQPLSIGALYWYPQRAILAPEAAGSAPARVTDIGAAGTVGKPAAASGEVAADRPLPEAVD